MDKDKIIKKSTKFQPTFKDLGTTTLFRITNFELFVKPNKYVMTFGLLMSSFCFGYLIYMNYDYDNQLQKQNAFNNQANDQDEKKPKSRWD